MVQKVRSNFEGYTKKKVYKTLLDWKVKEMVVHPTEDSFKHMIRSKLLNNPPIKVEDVTDSHTILGLI